MYDVIINNLPLSELIIVTGDASDSTWRRPGWPWPGREVELVGLPKREYRLSLALEAGAGSL